MNVHFLNTKVNETLHLFDSRKLDILLLQETCLDRESLNATARMAKKRQMTFHAANPQIRSDGRCFGGLACLSRWPVQPVKLNCYTHPKLACVTQALRVHRCREDPFLLANVHFQSSDTDMAQAQFESLLSELLSLGAPTIILGDWNLTPPSSLVAFYEARGVLHLGGTGVFPARKSGKCIDFAAGINRCLFHYETQYSGLGDHEVVQIHIPDIAPRITFHHARRQQLTDDEVSEDAWSNIWSEHSQTQFASFLQNAQIDLAWGLLSGSYEHALAANKRHHNTVPRHKIVTPKPREPLCRKSCFPESFCLRRLKRYIRRVEEFQRNPHPSLQKKIVDYQDYLLKVWPNLSEPEMLSNVCALKSWVAEIEKETRSARKKKALEKIALHDARAYQWLKRPAATEKPRDMTDPMPVAPEDQLLYVKHKWEAIWMQPPLQNSEILDPMMDNFPSYPHVEIVRSELYKLEQKTKGKAAGPDGWQGRLFAALPESAFSPLAMLWHLCLEHSMLPSTSCQARTVLIDKPDGDKRPLSIASLCWRLCASATLRKLQPWIATWIHKDLCGGLPDTRADFLHQRLMPDLQTDETQRPKVIGVKQDLSKCFDNTCSQQAITILAKFGLPPKLVRILKTFYRNHIRWLEIDGCVSAEPIKPIRSILQGCPFRVVLLSGIMTLWATHAHSFSIA